MKERQKEAGKEEAASLKQAGQVLPETARRKTGPTALFSISTRSYPLSYKGLQRSLTLSPTLFTPLPAGFRPEFFQAKASRPVGEGIPPLTSCQFKGA